ncbi:hypothetical protein ACFP3U_26630 [Kitasatospora misakiensis]|uniref:Uncharacterized protein n=1 Tax=Kitasatospora misakiensis TaxID=67330 RepID=A0ABW0X7U7_9ACTN
MRMPGFVAEASIGPPGGPYRTSAGPAGPHTAARQQAVLPAQSEVFCGVCALGGFGCDKKCHDCGPFDLFECCDSICTETVSAASTASRAFPAGTPQLSRTLHGRGTGDDCIPNCVCITAEGCPCCNSGDLKTGGLKESTIRLKAPKG